MISSLPADLDTARGCAAATGSGALSHPVTVRHDLHPEGALSLEIRVAGRAAQGIQAAHRCARGRGVVPR